MPQNLIKDLKTSETLEFLKGHSVIRTGRAHPALVEDIRSTTGTPTPIKNMVPSCLSSSDNDQPMGQDGNEAIESLPGLALGINPQNDGETIRLNLPSLTQAAA